MNRPLGFFGIGLAVFGAFIYTLDLLMPKAKEGDLHIGSFSGPASVVFLTAGAAFFLLAVKPQLFAALPLVGKFFQDKPADAPAPVNQEPPVSPR